MLLVTSILLAFSAVKHIKESLRRVYTSSFNAWLSGDFMAISRRYIHPTATRALEEESWHEKRNDTLGNETWSQMGKH